jgi:DNA-binding LacI/PurR family transcriptional regulator
MPKKVFTGFYRSLKRDILTNYREGDKYLTVRNITDKFDVSSQTAQKGIKKLIDAGILVSRQKVGLFVGDVDKVDGIAQKLIIVLSNKQDYHFYNAFMQGAASEAEKYGIGIKLVQNTYGNTAELGFGEYLTELDADGIIALSFRNAGLPFYYAMQHGVDIVSDIIIDELPILPAVQTDNYLHAGQAGTYLSENHCRDLYIIGFYPPGSKREMGFVDAVQSKATTVKYLQLSALDALSELTQTIQQASFATGFYLCDYASIYIFSTLCQHNDYKPRNGSVVLYDYDQEVFQGTTLSVPTVGPSFFTLGSQLCASLVTKWLTGAFPSPLQRKI